jgi:hypothetical protein
MARVPRIAALLSAVALGLPAAASGRVPLGFVGMMADGPVFAPGVSVDQQLTKMTASGVQRLRVAFNWAEAQPYASWSQVPPRLVPDFVKGPNGVPTAYASTDAIVSEAAAHNLPLLPVVTYAPGWDAVARGDHRQPARDGPYVEYLVSLIERYGPRGTFWQTHPFVPREPITAWQIWNEPNLTSNWATTPFAPSYVALVRAAHKGVKKADPSATVVLGGLTNYGWKDLGSIYAIKGSRDLFDVVAANAYTAHPSGVITILGYYRRVMDTHGDAHKPILATEVGWPSGLGKTTRDFGFNTTERGQAQKLAQLLPLLAQNRKRLGLAGFYYYTWMTTDPRNARPFDYAGLLHYDAATKTVRPKPAYWAFRRAVAALER